MPSDSNFPGLPPSPIRDDDKFIVNRNNVSHKINASDFLFYLADLDFPIVKPCDEDEDCPPGYTCFNGNCVLRCDGGCSDTDVTDNYSCCPEGHVCVEVDSSNSLCLPYPFPCDSLGTPDPCPPGYVCIEGLCLQLCSVNGDCPPGTICAELNGESVCIPYPFPCPELGLCPPGFECFNGFCVLDCSVTAECPDGSICLEVDVGTDLTGPIMKYYCVPYPFPCGSIPPYDECPPGFYCYGGECWPICYTESSDPNLQPNPILLTVETVLQASFVHRLVISIITRVKTAVIKLASAFQLHIQKALSTMVSSTSSMTRTTEELSLLLTSMVIHS